VKRADVYALIDAERERQAAKWADPHVWGKGDCSSPLVAPVVKAAVLQEECGEVARAVLDNDAAGLRTELVQLCAVAVAWMEGMT
jgi:NTP pyrophosphatase (non-canonical NTP hydrolase)